MEPILGVYCIFTDQVCIKVAIKLILINYHVPFSISVDQKWFQCIAS